MIDQPSTALIYATNLGLSASFFTLIFALRNFIRKFVSNWLEQQSRIDLLLTGLAAGTLVFMSLSFIGLNILFKMGASLFTLFYLPKFIAAKQRAEFEKAFDGSMVESLTTISSSLKAGITLRGSLEVAEKNCPPVFAKEISQALKEYRFGKPLEHCLDDIRQRVDTDNANIAFGAMIIGHQLGGNLPSILQKIVQTIRDRERVTGKLQSLTAQGRTQAILLSSAPPLIGVGMYFWDPVRMRLLTDTLAGQVLLSLAIALEVIGIIVMKKMLRLKI